MLPSPVKQVFHPLPSDTSIDSPWLIMFGAASLSGFVVGVLITLGILALTGCATQTHDIPTQYEEAK